jgi:hypothetical protein
VQPDGIPDELKALPQWCNWKLEIRQDRDGNYKWTKPPYQPNNSRASSDDPTTWHIFGDVMKGYERFRPWLDRPHSKLGFQGVGIFFAGDFVGIDLDHCIADGNLEPWAAEIVANMATYTETSPSGTGVKLWCRGELPTEKTGRRKGQIEIYSSGRYFTVTGHHRPDTPREVRECNGELTELWQKVFGDARRPNGKSKPRKPATAGATSSKTYSPTDEDILGKAGKAANAGKFCDLMDGDTSGYTSPSEVDMALAMILSFWTLDASQIERIMRQSKLVRDKWNEPRGAGTWIQETIASAIEKTTERYEWRRSASATGEDGPEILVDTNEERVTDEAIAALTARAEVYQRGAALVHVVREAKPPTGIARPQGTPQISMVPRACLREKMASSATWLQLCGQGETKPCHPPDWAVKAVEARGRWKGIRPLEAVVEEPVLRMDGTVLQTPGYDSSTGILYDPQVEFPPVPEHPALDQVKQALGDLLEVVADVPFASEVDQAAWLAGALTPMARFAYTGPSPLNSIESNVRGAGKSLSADAISVINTGRNMARASAPEDNQEARKLITTVAISGERLLLLDNVSGVFGCPALDAALTAVSWSDRVLGTNKMVKDVPLSTIWFATGNNIQFGADTARRVLPIRIESLEENPEERQGFRHPDLLAWVRQHRPRLVVAGLTILRAYHAGGQPDQGLRPWGSFEGWSHAIRDPLVWCALPDPAAGRQELRIRADTEASFLRRLLDGWGEIDPTGAGLTVKEALTRLGDFPDDFPILRAALAELPIPRGAKAPSTRSIGMKLSHLRHRVAGGRFLDSREDRLGTIWTVRRV